MTPVDFKAFRADFQEAMSKLEKKYNLTIKSGNIRYTADSFNMKFDANVKGKSTKAEKDYNTYRSLYNLPSLGTVFTFRGRWYKINGFNPSRPKFCIQTTRDDGKTYHFPKDTVLKYCI